jgi:3-methylcrotonyl-CoA carboxylase alpha subunit
VRIDTGVHRGAQVTPWYDPMLAKLIVHAGDRPAALQQLRSALAQVEIAGVASNVQLLRRLASSAAFAAAELDTGFIEKHRAELLPPRAAATDAVLAIAAFAELAAEQAAARTRALASPDPYSPWHEVDGWRLNEDSHHDLSFLDGDDRRRVRIGFAADGLRVQIDGRDHALGGEVLDDGGLLVRMDGHAFKARAVPEGAAWHIFADGEHHRLSVEGAVSAEAVEVAGSLAAPMPGKIVAVLTSAGARVSRGDPLMILEAMKMEHTITAPIDGVVKAIHYGAGEQVLEGAQLVELEA